MYNKYANQGPACWECVLKGLIKVRIVLFLAEEKLIYGFRTQSQLRNTLSVCRSAKRVMLAGQEWPAEFPPSTEHLN